jgi:plasmid stabilization system protein ParE
MPKSKFSIRLLSAAEQDFNDIVEYVLLENPSAAITISDAIAKNLNLLANNPQLGRVPNDEELLRMGYRYLVVFDYLIFYKNEAHTIFVYRIIHGTRDYKSLL